MKSENQIVLRSKVADGIAAAVPSFTKRDVYIPTVPGKAVAIIGMRRSGKTTLMWQCLAARLAKGMLRESLLYCNFEDERLAGMTASDLQFLMEEFYAINPSLRKCRAAFFLDEIQLVPNWEQFVRRVTDTENIEVFISGSSARLLSREVATSMRGRALEALVHPFSFREVLRHSGMEPLKPLQHLAKSQRSHIEQAFRKYLVQGGFPEVQDAGQRDAAMLLRTYVDVAVLRDVIERHAVTNITALRWLVRHLLGNPAASFSVEKFHKALKSQGLAIGKNTLHDYLSHLEDAFLVRTVSLHSASERQRMVNPRKIYPIDTGLVALYERTGHTNVGHALETTVLLELERRGYGPIDYVKTKEGYEVDFRAQAPDGRTWLIQVAATVSDPDTWQREIRALASAAAAEPNATALLLTADTIRAPNQPPPPLIWQAVTEWFLSETPHLDHKHQE